jgi:hypothetical protein
MDVVETAAASISCADSKACPVTEASRSEAVATPVAAGAPRPTAATGVAVMPTADTPAALADCWREAQWALIDVEMIPLIVISPSTCFGGSSPTVLTTAAKPKPVARIFETFVI